MNAKATLPPDWKPAEFNPNFNADETFEEQETTLDRLRCTLGVIANLSAIGGEDFKNAEVAMFRNDLAGMFMMFEEVVFIAQTRNDLMHKHICGKWGYARILAERALRGEA